MKEEKNNEKIKIPESKTKLIFAEGADDFYFLKQLLIALKIEDIHVFNFEGINNFTNFTKSVELFNDNYTDVTAILIARDSEQSSANAVKSINTSLRKSINILKILRKIKRKKLYFQESIKTDYTLHFHLRINTLVKLLVKQQQGEVLISILHI
jgi:hypothetical protein